MNQNRFHNAPPPPASNRGFTLVEISIVMIIIGLLIGGVFGGMRLIDIAKANSISSQLKAIESSTLTFKSIYGRLPGDLRNPNARLPNCTSAPCSVSGNGNGSIGIVYTNTTSAFQPYTVTSENYTFWQHLQASDLISLGIINSNDMNFGIGTPETAEHGVGYRITTWNWSQAPATLNGQACTTPFSQGAVLLIGNNPNNDSMDNTPCIISSMIDKKIDDGLALDGKFSVGFKCIDIMSASDCIGFNTYSENTNYSSRTTYDLQGF